jgi:hypothetical protein
MRLPFLALFLGRLAFAPSACERTQFSKLDTSSGQECPSTAVLEDRGSRNLGLSRFVIHSAYCRSGGRSEGLKNKTKPGASEHDEMAMGPMEIPEPNSRAG